MNKLEFVINSLFEENGISKVNGFTKYENIVSFYSENGLSLPACITFVETKNASRLTKDETIAIQKAYISQLIAGNVETETKNNYEAIGKDSEKVTFSDTVVFSECATKKGYGITAVKLIDALPASLLEKFQKETKKNTNSVFCVESIPAIIAELKKIQAPHTETEKVSK